MKHQEDSLHSGGGGAKRTIRDSFVWAEVSHQPLPVTEALDWVGRPDCGAMVLFSGTVRDHSDDHDGVTLINYEAYEGEVEPRLRDISLMAKARWPGLGRVAIIHRSGDVGLGEASVLVVVSAPHRREAFAAGRFCIDVLKKSVPVWKLEQTAQARGWVRSGVDIQTVQDAALEWDRNNMRTPAMSKAD